MEKKVVGKQSLMIAMAKHIRACARESKEHNKIETTFKFKLCDNSTEVSFGDKCFVVNDKLSSQCITNEALSESACKGFVYPDGSICRVILFGKPVKPFRMLQRLVKKYAGVDIAWDDFKSTCYDGNGYKIIDKTTYLCYSEDGCQRGVDFIRKNRTSKDVLKTGIVADGEAGCFMTALKLVVETPHGKKKAEMIVVD